MDTLIESYGRLGKRLVFIADGGTWIKNWIENAFPEAVSILDYYWILRSIVYHIFQSIVYQCFSPKFTSRYCFEVFISEQSLPLG